MIKDNLTEIDISGVWTALVTPFKGESIDTDKLSELTQLAVEAGITGVVPLGSTGESAAMDSVEKETVIRTVVSSAQGRLKVMVGAGTNNTTLTIKNVKTAAELGADAVLIVAPYYSKPTQEGLKRHFLTVADASDLPIVLYHIPSRCGVGIPQDLVIELAQHPRIIGIKEAGGDVWRSGEIARLAPEDFKVLSGDDPLTLALMSVGAKGVISVVSNFTPLTMKKLINLCLIDDFKNALKIHQKISPLLGVLGLETNPAPVKEAMNLKGLNVGDVRLPLVPVKPDTRLKIQSVLNTLSGLN